MGEAGCVSMRLCVSLQMVLWGALDPLAVEPFYSRSLMVRSMCQVGIWVRGVLKCSRSTHRRFDIFEFFPVAQSRILGGIWTCC